jgi:beta-galactosidase
VKYEPGELRVQAYKHGMPWATATTRTAGAPATLELMPDRREIRADSRDLSFVTVRILDRNGQVAPTADHRVAFSIEGPGEIVATDNGDPSNLEPFPSQQRGAFNGLCMVIVRGIAGRTGTVTLRAESQGLQAASTVLNFGK